MHVHRVEVRNFRLLETVRLDLERSTTVIVGRNNSGKTSLTELFRRLSADRAPAFRLEDFSLSSLVGFWKAFQLFLAKRPEVDIRAALPTIEIRLTLRYDVKDSSLGRLSEFIIDLDPDCVDAIAVISFGLRDGAIAKFFEDMDATQKAQTPAFCREMKKQVEQLFESTVYAQDPKDPLNRKPMDFSTLRAVVQGDFINAQRGLDDTTHKDVNLLGRVLEALLTSALAESADPSDRTVAEALEAAVETIQQDLDGKFQEHLKKLWPTLESFNYPGLGQERLTTETLLDVQRLLKDHTRVHYEGINGVNLPESYNGLGVRNLVFMLLKLFEYFKRFQCGNAPALHLVFIEEPEVHLHPQMQEVFIQQLNGIADGLAKQFGIVGTWPVQFIVTTHSSHLANKASFDAMRYFLCKPALSGGRKTIVKDVRDGLHATRAEDREFLHKYMTLTRCDLLFADKAVLIEGAAERILMPSMIAKYDKANPSDRPLASQYLTVMEVGGAYAHIFFPLLEFLELPTLIVTDIDAVGSDRKSCFVSRGAASSNGCIKHWFSNEKITLAELMVKTDAEKTHSIRRLAFQVPEGAGKPCGRSLEEAFVLANKDLFTLGDDETGWESEASERAKEMGKTEFAIYHAVTMTEWSVPKYISDGLRWLATQSTSVAPAVSISVPVSEGKATNASAGKSRGGSRRSRAAEGS